MVDDVELSDAVVRSYSVARNFAPQVRRVYCRRCKLLLCLLAVSLWLPTAAVSVAQEDDNPNLQVSSLDFHRNGERCVTSRSDGVMSMINCLSGT